jgi:phosphatidylglycerophosphatase A
MATHPFDLSKWQHWLAVGFGSGLSPKAPGTVGTLAALPLVYCLSFLPAWASLCLLLLGCWFGVWLCEQVSRDIGAEDHGAIVFDEIIGFAITMWAVPLQWWTLLLGFVLFRLFDIAKPGPVGWCDRQLNGGMGVMMDDIVAGVLACGLMHGVLLAFN